MCDVYYGKRDYDGAIADYNHAFELDQKLATAIYGRGLAKNKQKIGSGDPDIAAAKNLSRDVADKVASYGLI